MSATALHGRTVAAAATLAIAALGCRDSVGPTSGVAIESVHTAVVAFLERWDIGGAAYAIIRDGRLVMARGYGFADLRRREPVRPDHRFRVARVSKPITAVAALRAVDLGLVALNDTVFSILADLLPTGGPASAELLDITVAHLLHHTAGFTLVANTDPLVRTREIAADMGVPNPPTADAIVRWLAAQPLGFTPGRGYTYTNVGYVTSGRVLERVSGMPYEEFVRTAVFAPVGVSDAGIGGPQRTDRLDGEVEYDARGTEFPSIFDGEPFADAAYGGLHLHGLDASSGWVLSAVDLARFAVAVDGDPSVADLLSPAMQTYMVTDGTPNGAGYGAGWFVGSAGGVAFWDHSGGMPGTASYLGTRGDGISVAAVLNRVGGGDTFWNEFIGGLWRAVNAVAQWPDRDLFPQFAR